METLANVMVNIVIVTKDRNELMLQTMRSLYATVPEDQFTLTVIDDGSMEEVEPQLDGLGKHGQNRFVRRVIGSDHMLGRLKSMGVRLSSSVFGRGEWLSLADNDCYFKLGWLEQMISLAQLTEPYGWKLWGGQNHPYHYPSSFEAQVPSGPGIKFSDCSTLAGTHMMMRWETWDRFSDELISEGPGVCRGEDVRFCQAIKSAGGRIATPIPSAECVVDCGITQTGGSVSPGADVKRSRQIEGILYL